MNRQQRKAFGEYVRETADLMGLRDWHFNIAYEDTDEVAGAGPERPDGKVWGAISDCEPHRKFCWLTFRKDITQWELDALEATVVHELLHCHFAAMTDLVRSDLHGHLANTTYEVFQDGFTRLMEWTVDGIAYEWARRLPSFEWPKPKKTKR